MPLGLVDVGLMCLRNFICTDLPELEPSLLNNAIRTKSHLFSP